MANTGNRLNGRVHVIDRRAAGRCVFASIGRIRNLRAAFLSVASVGTVHGVIGRGSIGTVIGYTT